MDLKPNPDNVEFGEVVEELRRTNRLLAQLLKARTNPRLAVRQGVLTSLGGVIGATVLVSILLWLLKPFERLELLAPTLERLAQQVETRERR